MDQLLWHFSLSIDIEVLQFKGNEERLFNPPCNLNQQQQIAQVTKLPLFGSQNSWTCHQNYT